MATATRSPRACQVTFAHPERPESVLSLDTVRFAVVRWRVRRDSNTLRQP